MSEEQLKSSESRSSIELTKNTKGYNWSIKRYYKEEEKVEDILIEIKATNDKLKKEYGDVL